MKRIVLMIAVIMCIPRICHAIGVSARSACLIAADSAQIIYEKNAHDRAPMASTTKMMTALLAAESDVWEETATVSLNAQNQEGTKLYLSAGDKMRISDLTCGMMLNSGNDASMVIAEHIAGDSVKFAKMMTERAQELGAKDTQFITPNGLDAEGHYSTAYDLALIAREVINNEKLAEIVKCRDTKVTTDNGNIVYLHNHNKLLWNYGGAIGVKTGYTKLSGRCLVSAAERDGVRLIAVTMNAPDDWNDHRQMLDYGFSVCTMSEIVSAGYVIGEVHSDGERVGLYASDDVNAVAINGRTKDCEIILHRPKELFAPINRGEKLGCAEVIQNGYLIAEFDLLSDREVYLQVPEKEGIFEKIRDFFKKMRK